MDDKDRCVEASVPELSEIQLIERIEGRLPSACATEEDLRELEDFVVTERD
jgi:hypothetical protein